MKQVQIQIHELGKLNNFCLKKKRLKWKSQPQQLLSVVLDVCNHSFTQAGMSKKESQKVYW